MKYILTQEELDDRAEKGLYEARGRIIDKLLKYCRKHSDVPCNTKEHLWHCDGCKIYEQCNEMKH